MTPSGIDPRYLRRVKLRIETAGSAEIILLPPAVFICQIMFKHLLTKLFKQDTIQAYKFVQTNRCIGKPEQFVKGKRMENQSGFIMETAPFRGGLTD